MISIAMTGALTVIIISASFYFLKKKGHDNAVQNLTIWVIFSVILALTPLLFNFLLPYIKGGLISYEDVLKKGELLIISVAIGTSAVGQMIGSGSNNKIYKIISAGCCLILVITASLLFAAIASPSITNQNIDETRLAAISLYMFYMTIVSGSSCVILEGIS